MSETWQVYGFYFISGERGRYSLKWKFMQGKALPCSAARRNPPADQKSPRFGGVGFVGLGFFLKVFSKCANKEPGKEEEAAWVSLVFVLSRFSRPLFAGRSSAYYCVQLSAAKLYFL